MSRPYEMEDGNAPHTSAYSQLSRGAGGTFAPHDPIAAMLPHSPAAAYTPYFPGMYAAEEMADASCTDNTPGQVPLERDFGYLEVGLGVDDRAKVTTETKL